MNVRKTMTSEVRSLLIFRLYVANVLCMQDIINLLERFIQDDIERHSNRPGELDKPVRAYNDTVEHNGQGIMEDEKEGLFEDEEDASAFARLVFLNRFAWFCAHLSRKGNSLIRLASTSSGVDLFGFKEIRLDIEFGLSKSQGSFKRRARPLAACIYFFYPFLISP